MRWKTLVALIALSAVALSGCVGGGGDGDDTDDAEHEDECDGLEGVAHEECHDDDDGDGNETDGNETIEPNLPPTAALTLTDDSGAVLNETSFIMAGGNITFDASASTDVDGSVELVGLTVTDSNGTRNAQLAVDGAFQPVTLQFNDPGIVNITLRVLDDDGDGASLQSVAYVNNVVTISDSISGADAGKQVDPTNCQGPTTDTAGSILDQQYSHTGNFGVAAGTRWIEADVTSGDVRIAICSPEKENLSGSDSSHVETDDGGEAGYPANIGYRIFTVANAPGEFSVDVTLHFEPKA